MFNNIERRKLQNGKVFDPVWYVEQYPDVSIIGIDPLEHYILYGARLGRSGSPHYKFSGRTDSKSIIIEQLIADAAVVAACPAEVSSVAPSERFCTGSKKHPDPSFLVDAEHKSTFRGPAVVVDEGKVSDITFVGTIAIHLHLYYQDSLPYIKWWLSSIPVPFDLFVSVTKKENLLIAEQAFEDLSCLNRLVVEECENRGRDIGPMLAAFGRRLSSYDYIGHLHTKKSNHTSAKKDWAGQLGHSLFHSSGFTTQVLNLFSRQDNLGLVFPVYHSSISGQIKWGANFKTSARELSTLVGGSELTESDLLPFPAGSFFLARTEAIRPLLEAGYQFADFEVEAGQVDGTLAHAIERLFVLVADRRGYTFRQIAPSKPHSLGRSFLDGRVPYQSEFFDRVRRGEKVPLSAYARPELAGLKVRFYTCSTGGYDEPLPFEAFVEGADYIFYTDVSGGHQEAQWCVRPLAFGHQDPIKTARRHKTQPHKIFDEVDIAVWIDGNIAITGDVAGMIAKVIENEGAFGVVPHPYRSTVAEELEVLVRLELDDPELMADQLSKFRKEGFPDEGGLTETNFLVMDLRREETRVALNHWWRVIDQGSRRDQLSFDYACWKAGAKKVPLIDNGLSVRADARFAYFSHGGKGHSALNLREQLSNLWLDREVYANGKQHRQNTLQVDVVVCIHNSPDDIALCLRSISQNRDSRTRIILIDDGSDVPTQRIISRHLSENPSDIMIRHNEARGYTKAANAGLRASNADYVILLNSDTIVPRGWVTDLVRAGEADHDVGIVGPLSNAASWQSVPSIFEAGDLAVNTLPADMSVDQVAEVFARLPAKAVYPCPVVNGFCFAVKRKVIDTIGYLDEDAFPQGYGEENDYCLRIAEHGMTCGFTVSTYIYHAKSKSFNHDRRKLLSAQGWKALIEKHGEDRLKAIVEEMKAEPALEMARRWFRSQVARKEPETKAIALYLPQFHSFAFNDAAWGPGFSEWRNVVKAKPRFEGHEQPLLPGELGFYDLRTPETLAKQAGLAKMFGVYGMAVYYYRFGRKRLMAEPTDCLLASPSIPLRFFYCWANEDWTRAWDGKTNDILLKQDYSESTLQLLVDDFCYACADTRYIRIDGRPVLMIYQLDQLPDPEHTLKRLRELVIERIGIEPLVGVTWNERFQSEWSDLVDFIVQFPPHRTPRVSKRMLLNRAEVAGATEGRADHLESYDHVIEQSVEAMDVYDRLAPGVCPAWDNSPRRERRANILIGSTPTKFEKWVEVAASKAVEKHRMGKTVAPLLFVNAWNEWAEGAVMEPSERNGRAYLQALRHAIF